MRFSFVPKQPHLPCFSRTGASLVEVIVAMAIVGLGMIAIVSGFALFSKTQNASATQQNGSKYSTEALEWVRNERDRLGWDEFYARISVGTYCVPDVFGQPITSMSPSATCTTPIANTPNAKTSFTRTLTVSKGSDQVTATSRVTWFTNQVTQVAEQTLVLHRWR